ncbi:MAG: hypothetical protein COA78_20510 [Blastopirellula sp.]|nr:MAG: hypothetical protein COA78_20510 [Blastopirellula sp.]
MNARQYPRSAEAMGTLGWIYYRLDRLPEAERALGAASSGGNISPDIAFYLASLLLKQKKYESAGELLAGALKSTGPFYHRAESLAVLTQLEEKSNRQVERNNVEAVKETIEE